MKNEALISARKSKGWTQEELAGKLGCQKSSISNWENGYSNPKLEDAFKLAGLLESELSVLFSGVLVQESQTSEQPAEEVM